VRFLIDLVIAVAVAVVVGVGSAWYAVGQGHLFGAVAVGDWTAWPADGTLRADPYALARIARSGEVPLGAGEGLVFTASTDDSGARLNGQCTYTIAGETPAARLWTLTVTDNKGRLLPNLAQRQGFHSREVVRDADGDFAIIASPTVQPGNWLPVGNAKLFDLVFRLYDTPLATGSQLATLTMPTIKRAHCP
jgi:hypothetical protein